MMDRWPGRLNPPVRLFLLVWALVLSTTLPGARLIALSVVLLAIGVLDGGRGLATLRKGRFWVLFAGVIVLSSFLLGEAESQRFRLIPTRAGLEEGLWMSLRAMCLSLAFGIGLGGFSVSDLAGLSQNARWRGLGFALGVALNLSSILGETIRTAYDTLRLRGTFRRPLLAARLLAVTVISNSLRYGDDVVIAALARGFDPDRYERKSASVHPLEWAFMASLIALAGLLCLAALPW